MLDIGGYGSFARYSVKKHGSLGFDLNRMDPYNVKCWFDKEPSLTRPYAHASVKMFSILPKTVKSLYRKMSNGT